METYVRYFVTQQLGTAYGRVEFDDTATGHAMIVIPDEPPVYRKFSFRVSELSAAFPDRSTWPEKVLRVAISQTHNDYARPGAKGSSNLSSLSFATSPWPGVLVELEDPEEDHSPRKSTSASAARSNHLAR